MLWWIGGSDLSLSLCVCVIDLDMEYRYWAFIEGHPAHTTLPVNARVEAMDVLTWAWTGESVVSTMMDSNAYSMFRSSSSLPTYNPCTIHPRRMPGTYVSPSFIQQR